MPVFLIRNKPLWGRREQEICLSAHSVPKFHRTSALRLAFTNSLPAGSRAKLSWLLQLGINILGQEQLVQVKGWRPDTGRVFVEEQIEKIFMKTQPRKKIEIKNNAPKNITAGRSVPSFYARYVLCHPRIQIFTTSELNYNSLSRLSLWRKPETCSHTAKICTWTLREIWDYAQLLHKMHSKYKHNARAHTATTVSVTHLI